MFICGVQCFISAVNISGVKCDMVVGFPKSSAGHIYRNVQMSITIKIGGSLRKLLTSNRLEMRFNLYFMAHLSFSILFY